MVLAAAALLFGVAAAFSAFAHHPGSHATRLGGSKVTLDVAAMGTDACTTVGSIALGVPRGVTPPAGNQAVTVRLQRPSGALCATVVSAVRGEAELTVPANVRVLHLYVVDQNESVVATERVPIRLP